MADIRKKADFRSLIRALHYRNYRLYFIGQGISLIGTWMQRVAVGWLVYRLTDSPLLLGIVGFAGQIPAFLLAPFAGVLADRWDRRRILILTQCLSMIQAGILAALVLTETVMIWEVIALSAMLGLINAFDMPVRQAFTVEMIDDRKDLGNAIALNSSMVNAARMLGPSAAGILIAVFGEGLCFLINAVSYLTVILSLVMMRVKQRDITPGRDGMLKRLREGFRYAAGFEPIRAILLLLCLISLTGLPYAVLMPVFARDILQGGPHTLGFLMGSTGVGALAGAVFLASRTTVLGLGRGIPRAVTLFGAALLAFSLSRILWLSMALLVLAGFGQMVHLASSNTLLQTLVDDDKRGRVMSFYAMSFMGMMPIGSLLGGALARWIGAPVTLLLGGIVCILGAVIFRSRLPAMNVQVRPIYIRMGVIPEIASGIQTATETTIQK